MAFAKHLIKIAIALRLIMPLPAKHSIFVTMLNSLAFLGEDLIFCLKRILSHRMFPIFLVMALRRFMINQNPANSGITEHGITWEIFLFCFAKIFLKK